MTGQLGTAREGLMNIAASFSLSYETKVINPVGESQTTEGVAH
jgi:hypothetical protein